MQRQPALIPVILTRCPCCETAGKLVQIGALIACLRCFSEFPAYR